MRIILVLLLSLFFGNQCLACMGGIDITLTSGKKIDFSYGPTEGVQELINPYKDPTVVKKKLKVEGGNFSEGDISILMDFISRELSVEEQTDQQYLDMQKRIDLEPVSCKSKVKIERRGRWTGFIPTGAYWRQEGSMSGCMRARC